MGEPPRGLVVVVAGPDGTGKTTVADRLAEGVLSSRELLRLHHRPGVLPAKTAHAGPVTEPHRDPPYPGIVALAKTLYLFADYVLGWALRVRPVLRRGGNVLLERGWWDVVVDPRRYRLRPPSKLARLLGRLLPRPHVTLVLHGDGAVLAPRTGELPVAELDRQVAAWRALPPRLLRPVYIDTAAPLEDVVATAAHALPRNTCGRGLLGIFSAGAFQGGWVALPSRRAPRWYLPDRPGTAVRSSLLVYAPASALARAGWEAVRALGSVGGLRLLRPGLPPFEIVGALTAHVAPGGHAAISVGNHPGRAVALLVDHAGRPTAVAKVALDEDGRRSLAAEAGALERLAPLLPDTLRAPAILGRTESALLLEPVAWRPRRRPWLLPAEVARDLGVLGRGGAAHGDCAPWNLLRTQAGRWYLVDWADATDEAPAFTDLWHYLVQAHALLGHPGEDELLAGLRERGWVGDAVRAYAEGARRPVASPAEHLATYLRASLPLMDATAPDGRRGLAARERLLARLDRADW